jgi:hypothetical protein
MTIQDETYISRAQARAKPKRKDPVSERDADDLLREADYLDNKAKEWLGLAAECVTDNTRRKCLWNENQCRGAAVRRWRDAQAIINPLAPAETMRVGGIEVNLDEEDFGEFAIPDRIRELLGPAAEGLV